MGQAQGMANQGMAAAQGVAGQAQDAAAALDHPAGAAAGAPADAEEMYEQVVERLRRDLIAELEQNGHLLRDHP